MSAIIPDIYYKVENTQNNTYKIWSVKRSMYIEDTDIEYQNWITLTKTRDCPIAYVYEDDDTVFECNTPLMCPNKNGVSNEEGLIETLKFYGYPLGTLTDTDELRNQKYQEVYMAYKQAISGFVTMPLPQPTDIDIIAELAILGASDPDGLTYIIDKLRSKRQELFLLIRDAKTKQELENIKINFPI